VLFNKTNINDISAVMHNNQSQDNDSNIDKTLDNNNNDTASAYSDSKISAWRTSQQQLNPITKDLDDLFPGQET
jgi:hypothetical protein